MLLLPRNLAKLAQVSSKDVGKYSLCSVCLEDKGEGKYRAVATNGKMLAMVDGEGELPESYPDLPALKSAPNGATDSLIPVSSWVEAFDLVPTKAATKRVKPVLGNIAVVMAPNETTFAATDLDKARSLTTRNAEGRFPAYGEIFNDLKKKTVLATVKLNAKMLRELLQVAEQFTEEDTTPVTLEVFGQDDAVIVKAQNRTQQFTSLIMPLS